MTTKINKLALLTTLRRVTAAMEALELKDTVADLKQTADILNDLPIGWYEEWEISAPSTPPLSHAVDLAIQARTQTVPLPQQIALPLPEADGKTIQPKGCIGILVQGPRRGETCSLPICRLSVKNPDKDPLCKRHFEAKYHPH